MRTTHCTQQDLQKALDIINKKYQDNIKFNPDSNGPTRFTLRVNGKGPGAGYGTGYFMGLDWAKKRRTGGACWHVHGDFFDALFTVAPDAIVYSRGNRITKDQGNWEDYNVGSMLYPAYASQCCECF